MPVRVHLYPAPSPLHDKQISKKHFRSEHREIVDKIPFSYIVDPNK